jgi:hypothetical protein
VTPEYRVWQSDFKASPAVTLLATARRLLDEHHGMLGPILGKRPAALSEEQ